MNSNKTIPEIIIAKGVPYAGAEHKAKRSGWLNIDCPFCGSQSGKFHMGISETSFAAHCWSCGKQKLWEVLREYDISVDFKKLKTIRVDRTPTGKYKPPKTVDLLPQHRRYLEKGRTQKLDPDELIRLWGIRSTPIISDEYRNRIFIPIRCGGEDVSWLTRSHFKNSKQPYVAATPERERIRGKELLYGMDYVRRTVVVCEGVFDAWAIGMGAVATLGVSYTPEQLMALATFPRVVICFDSDRAGQRRADQLGADLDMLGTESWIVRLETGSDPSSAKPKEIKTLKKEFCV